WLVLVEAELVEVVVRRDRLVGGAGFVGQVVFRGGDRRWSVIRDRRGIRCIWSRRSVKQPGQPRPDSRGRSQHARAILDELASANINRLGRDLVAGWFRRRLGHAIVGPRG